MQRNRAFLTTARTAVSRVAAYFGENALKNVVDYSVWGLGLLYIVGVAVSIAKV